VDEVRASLAARGKVQLAALHAGALSSAERLLTTAGAMVPGATRLCTERSPVMVAHAGAGMSELVWRLLAHDDPGGRPGRPAGEARIES
jgi:hypothetical protein